MYIGGSRQFHWNEKNQRGEGGNGSGKPSVVWNPTLSADSRSGQSHQLSAVHATAEEALQLGAAFDVITHMCIRNESCSYSGLKIPLISSDLCDMKG